MKKRTTIILSAVLGAASLLVILGVQFFTGGRNPQSWLMLALMSVIGGSIQAMTCALFPNRFVRSVPLVLAAALAVWGTYLYLFSSSWVNAERLDLMVDYWSPLLGCGIVVFCRMMRFGR